MSAQDYPGIVNAGMVDDPPSERSQVFRTEENMSTAVTAPIQTQEQKLEECRRAGHWVGDMCCWNCGGEGLSDHDCGEDCCCCLHPEPNVTCDICEGKGGWKVCYTCNPEAYYDGY